MISKLRIICLMLIGVLCLVAVACEDSNLTDQTASSIITQQPQENTLTDTPVQIEPTLITELPASSIGKTFDIQAKLVPCEPLNRLQPSNRHVTWQPIQTSQPLGEIASISTGRMFDAAGYGWEPGISYAISKDGKAWFWGYARKEIAFPQPLLGLEHVQEISGAYALTTDGQVWLLQADDPPSKVNGLNDVSAIQQLGDLQGKTLYTLKRNGTIWKLEFNSTLPVQVSDFKDVRDIYGSEFSLFILEKNGRLSYLNGIYGGSLIEKDLSKEISDKISQIAVGYDDQALIQTVKGKMYTYSPNEDTMTRTPLADNADRMAVVGDGLYLFVKQDGSVWGWGQNKNNILGEDRAGSSEVPVSIAGLANIIDIQAGTDHVLALDDKGQVFSWGSNMTGQLGRIPLIFDTWQELGNMDGIQQIITQLKKPYFIRKDGTLWSLEADRLTYQVNGLTNIQMLTTLYGMPVTLSKDGKVRIWSDNFASCQMLSIPLEVKQLVGSEDNMLIQTTDNRFVLVNVKPIFENGTHQLVKMILESTEIIRTEGDWTSQVKSLSANEYTYLALTDDGRVFYSDLSVDSSKQFKPIPELSDIQQLAPEYYVRYTLEPSSVWALNKQGRVFEIIVSPLVESWDHVKDIEVTLGSNIEENITNISGRMRVTKDGYIFEHDWISLPRQLVPEPIDLISSNYSYANEGPGSHYHLLVTNNHNIVIMGYNPFGQNSSSPNRVILP